MSMPRLSSVGLAWVLLLFAGRAHAVERVMVIDLSTEASEDDCDAAELATDLSEELRDAATWVDGWRLHELYVGLDELLSEHDCESPSVSCMESAAEAAGVTRLVFGTVEQTDLDHMVVTLTLHRRGWDRFAAVVVERLEIDRMTRAAMQRVAESLWSRLAGPSFAPVEALGNDTAVEDDTADDPLRAEPPSEIDRAELVAGVVTGAAGVLMLGAAAYAYVRLGDIGDDPTLLEFRRRLPPDRDACDEARGGASWGASPDTLSRVDALCGEAQTLTVAQPLLLLAGVLTGGFGTWLVIDALRGEPEEEPAAHVRLTPRFGTEGARLDATVAF